MPPHGVEVRAEELEYSNQMGVYEVVDMPECIANTKQAQIPTRWIDVNKGDSTSPKLQV